MAENGIILLSGTYWHAVRHQRDRGELAWCPSAGACNFLELLNDRRGTYGRPQGVYLDPDHAGASALGPLPALALSPMLLR